MNLPNLEFFFALFVCFFRRGFVFLFTVTGKHPRATANETIELGAGRFEEMLATCNESDAQWKQQETNENKNIEIGYQLHWAADSSLAICKRRRRSLLNKAQKFNDLFAEYSQASLRECVYRCRCTFCTVLSSRCMQVQTANRLWRKVFS